MGTLWEKYFPQKKKKQLIFDILCEAALNNK